MKKNKMMRIASVLLVAVLLSTCAISGTFAKYASKFVATTTATVAKWDVDATLGSATGVFDLFATINDTLDSNDEDDVADTLIAPGTEGQFTIVLNADNEVTTDYKIDFTLTKTNDNLPIEFSVDGGQYKSTLDRVTGTIGLDNNVNWSREIIVKWRWAIGTVNATTGIGSDNDYGESANTVTVGATVVFEQVD